jgi:hypothetical protein
MVSRPFTVFYFSFQSFREFHHRAILTATQLQKFCELGGSGLQLSNKSISAPPVGGGGNGCQLAVGRFSYTIKHTSGLFRLLMAPHM